MHRDVRAQNIVFTKNTSVLIDYGLLAKLGSCYPQGYNHNFEERHPGASAEWPMYKTHGTHSVLHMMEKCATTKIDLAFVRDKPTGKELGRILAGLDKLEQERPRQTKP